MRNCRRAGAVKLGFQNMDKKISPAAFAKTMKQTVFFLYRPCPSLLCGTDDVYETIGLKFMP